MRAKRIINDSEEQRLGGVQEFESITQGEDFTKASD